MTKEEEKPEITPIIKEKDQRQKDIFKSWKIIIGVIAVLAIIVAIVYKVQNPEFKSSTLFIVIGISILSFIIVFYFFKLRNKIVVLLEEKKEEILLPKPVSREILLEKLHNEAFMNIEYMNHVSKVIDHWPESINGEEIHCFWVEVVYEDYPGDSKERFVIYNANHSERLPGMIRRSLNESKIPAYEIRRVMNKMATRPVEDPNVERSIVRNPTLGIETETIRKTRQKKEEKKEHKKSDEFTEE